MRTIYQAAIVEDEQVWADALMGMRRSYEREKGIQFNATLYLNEDGSIKETAEVGGYTALTAPIIYWNSHGSYVGMVPFGIAGMSTRSTQKGWVLNMIANGFVVCMAGERGKQTAYFPSPSGPPSPAAPRGRTSSSCMWKSPM